MNIRASSYLESRPVGTPRGALGSLLRQLLAWRETARQRRQLASLTTEQLRDVGITTTDVGRELSKPFWRS